MTAPAWHLLTGELSRGGIGDYTRLLADALADAGREVHAWSPDAAGVTLRRASAHPMRGFGRDAFAELGRALDGFSAPRRLLVQYAPQAWGMRGMNVALGRWLVARRRTGDDVRVMFHEPFFPFGWQRPQRNLLAAVNRWMARDLLRASTQAYVSTFAWERLLRPLAPSNLPITTLPIPSTIPFVDDPARVASIRKQISEDGCRPVFVHFGTYGGMIAPMLIEALGRLIERRPDARILLLGGGGAEFAARLRADEARFADALVAPGFQSAEDVSLHLQAADVALQPYPDGADTRRTSLMACLANGVPTVTTRGRFTRMDMIVAAAGYPSVYEPHRVGEIAAQVYEDPSTTFVGTDPNVPLREATRAFYLEHFAMERTVERLLAEEGGG
ncbi:glycosyltransferase [Longimicrobium sp.]|uniref:glycosyltransferase n=1 Tax=Longimicrobium sp. TaxID=2029185 RepID=UPI002E32CFF0|nr:glycosyltransferase [Longimicrobium sp.]HEX6042118.1 glycosyltransferase [Longimicrobium sp.]